MGVNVGRPHCYTNYAAEVVAPNPDPSQYKVLEFFRFPHATLLKVSI